MTKIVNLMFITLGFISLAVGSAGIIVPVLPTAPFYLLTLFCFAKGSRRFHIWFTNTSLYKKHLDDFVKTRSMPFKTKLAVCIPVTALIVLMMIIFSTWWITAILSVIILTKLIYFFFFIKSSRGVPK